MGLRLPKSGNMLERREPIGTYVKGRREVCDARIDAPFGISKQDAVVCGRFVCAWC